MQKSTISTIIISVNNWTVHETKRIWLEELHILIECQTHKQKINNATATDPTCLIITSIYIWNYREKKLAI